MMMMMMRERKERQCDGSKGKDRSSVRSWWRTVALQRCDAACEACSSCYCYCYCDCDCTDDGGHDEENDRREKTMTWLVIRVAVLGVVVVVIVVGMTVDLVITDSGLLLSCCVINN